jgi:crotonobetainyl-CoA:carnitine CoA-transferase CaiB-like acyl-CoA transferase
MTTMLERTLTLEVGRTRAAAFAGKLIADAGGTVICAQDAARINGLSAAARLYMDGGKDVVTWDDSADAILLEELLPHADLFLTDLSRDELERRGLDWNAMHRIAPSLTYVSMTAVGRDHDPGSTSGELSMQALSGVMHMVGDPEREPLALPYCTGGLQLGLHGAAAGLCAMHSSRVAGEGHHVEISGAEVLASYVRIYGAVANYYSIPLRRAGRRAPGSGGRYPFGIFPCRDGYVAMICRTGREWDSLLEMMGHPAWSKEARYQDLYAVAIEYPDEIDALIAPWLMTKSRDDLLTLAQQYAVPVAPVRHLDEVIADPQLRDYRGFFDELTLSDGRAMRVPGRPWASPPRVLHERVARRADSMAAPASAEARAGAQPTPAATVGAGDSDA